jgi:hypothetical protein
MLQLVLAATMVFLPLTAHAEPFPSSPEAGEVTDGESSAVATPTTDDSIEAAEPEAAEPTAPAPVAEALVAPQVAAEEAGARTAVSAAAAGTLTVGVQKTNDANHDGVFHKGEQVPFGFSGPVSFSVTITNTNSIPVYIIGLTDEVPPGAPGVNQCSSLIGTILQPGEFVVCTFTQFVGPQQIPGPHTIDRFRAKVAPPPCPNCIPCPDPPLAPRPPIFVNCVPATDVGEGFDETDIDVGMQPPPPPVPPVVVKTNDADGNHLFNLSETARTPAQPVTFRVVVTNPSSNNVPMTITAVTDVFPGQGLTPVSCTPNLVGVTLQPGQSASCEFTLAGYSPPAGTSKTNTVSVTVSERCILPGNVATTCFPVRSAGSTVNTLPALEVTVDKTNNADGDAVYMDAETASSQGQPVSFQAVITNPSPVPVTITALTDEFPGQPPFTVACLPDLVGTTVPAFGTSPPCTFTVANYSPAPGTDRIDTVRVTVTEQCGDAGPCRTATASDPSTVRTREAPPPPPPLLPTPTPTLLPTPTPTLPPVVRNALPRTGTSSSDRATTGALLVLTGGVLCMGARVRARRRAR